MVASVEYDGPFCLHLPGFDEFGDPVDVYEAPLPAAAVPEPTPFWNRELGRVDVPQADFVFAPIDLPAPLVIRRLYVGSTSEALPMP